jgi:hypothetical protein
MTDLKLRHILVCVVVLFAIIALSAAGGWWMGHNTEPLNLQLISEINDNRNRLGYHEELLGKQRDMSDRIDERLLAVEERVLTK